MLKIICVKIFRVVEFLQFHSIRKIFILVDSCNIDKHLLTSGMMSGGNACHPGCLGNWQNWEWNCLLYRSSGVISLRIIGGQKFPIFKVRGT